MGKRKLKSEKAVPLPNDGVVYHFFRLLSLKSDDRHDDMMPLIVQEYDHHLSVDTANIVALPSSSLMVGIEPALKLLSWSSSSASSPSVHEKLIHSLLYEAKFLRDQLQAIQAYRSTLLNWRSQGRIMGTSAVASSTTTTAVSNNNNNSSSSRNSSSLGNGADNDDDTDDAGIEITTGNEQLLGLYRILLEWSLSNEAPQPLRRACQSTLDTLASTYHGPAKDIDDIHTAVIWSLTRRSIGTNNTGNGDEERMAILLWARPMQSLFEGLCYRATEETVVKGINRTLLCQAVMSSMVGKAVELNPTLEQHSFARLNGNETQADLDGYDNASLIAFEESVNLAVTIKTFLTPILHHDFERSNFDINASSADVGDMTTALLNFLWTCLRCAGIPSDGLSKVGVAYGQALLFSWRRRLAGRTSLNATTEEQIQEMARSRLEIVLSASDDTGSSLLHPLNKLATLQGIAATLPNSVLFHESLATGLLADSPLSATFLFHARHATDAAVRLLAFRSLHTLINRCASHIENQMTKSDENSGGRMEKERREISMSLPPMFRGFLFNLVEQSLELVLSTWENPPGRQVASAVPGLFQSLVPLLDETDDLVKRILAQPANRKGRYIALETLLPVIGAKAFFSKDTHEDSDDNKTHNSMTVSGQALVASLVDEIGVQDHNAKSVADLLGKLLCRLREEMGNTNGKSSTSTMQTLNRKQRKRLEKQQQKLEGVTKGTEFRPKTTLSEDWLHIWAPVFASKLVRNSLSRRKQIGSFCLPLIITMVGGTSRKLDAAFAVSCLLGELGKLQREFEQSSQNDVDSMNFSSTTETFSEKLIWAKFEVVRQASSLKLLRHGIVNCQELVEMVRREVPRSLLTDALVHSSPANRLVAFASIESLLVTYAGSDASLPNTLLKDEFHLWKMSLPYAYKSGGKEYTKLLLQYISDLLERALRLEAEETVDEVNSKSEKSSSLYEFVVHFLVGNIVLEQGSYPGTVAEKEAFVLALMNRIIDFVHPPESNKIGERQATEIEERIRVGILQAVVVGDSMGCDSISSLLSLSHSMWDGTRSEAFNCLVKVILVAHAKSVDLPAFISLDSLWERALFLASSPRSREADTGARILATIFVACDDIVKRKVIFARLLGILFYRIRVTEGNSLSSSYQADGENLPLCHGVVKSFSLMIDCERIISERAQVDSVWKKPFGELISLLHRSIKFCLSVVADIKESDGDNDYVNDYKEDTPDSVPLNVNTGAIGANGVFASVHSVSPDDERKKISSQRIIVGSWLLTKEACAAMANVLTTDLRESSFYEIEESGTLFIRLLVSLKHQGAAFAAHKAMQQISSHCFRAEDKARLPWQWSRLLLAEISSEEKVRNSTLRRSTGYALGFLSLMRSEPPPSVAPRSLSPFVLSTLLRLSLPPMDVMQGQLASLHLRNLSGSDSGLLVVSRLGEGEPQAAYDRKCRVHALNILRLIILDAPMASEVRPFVADAIVSAILGYSDEFWDVRNSSTMVFSALMLRVIDADKNAAAHGKPGSTAITAFELFRSYQTLPSFLDGTLRLATDSNWNTENSQSFPVLLLLSRLQPVRESSKDISNLTNPFVVHSLRCLGHKHHHVRLAVAKAIANLSTKQHEHPISSLQNLVAVCQRKLRSCRLDWNEKHGALLLLRELTSRETDPSSILTFEPVGSLIMWFITPPSDGVLICPAPLSSVVFEILSDIDARGQPEFLDSQLFVRSCLRFIDAAVSKVNVDMEIGLASTLALAAKCCIEASARLLWSNFSNSLQFSLSSFSGLLKSNRLDVRMWATKALKKHLWRDLDNLSANAAFTPDAKRDVLIGLTQTLSEALSLELSRSETPVHPPTRRRLCRCLLEVLYSTKRMKVTVDTSAGTSPDNLWSLAQQMLRPHDSFSKEGTEDCLIGNGLEIMGFSLAGSAPAQRIKEYIDIMQAANHQLSHWRLRHGIVVSLMVSKILSTPPLSSSHHPNLLWEVLRLMQDVDPDVRFVASCSMRAMYQSEAENSSMSVSDLKGLERAYTGFGRHFSPGLQHQMIAQLHQHSRGLVNSLSDFVSQTDKLSDHMLAMNIDNNRKIFEEEDPNSFEEVLLSDHFIISILVNRGQDLEKASVSLADELLMRCKIALFWMQSQLSTTTLMDPVNEPSRGQKIFPALHSLLLSACTIIFLGTGGSEHGVQAQSEAVSVMKTLSSRTNHYVHPQIVRAIHILADARAKQSETKKGIFNACFLISPTELLGKGACRA